MGTAALAVGAVCTAGVWAAALAPAVATTAATPVATAVGRRFSQDQEALVELAKLAQRVGATTKEARVLLEWANEYGIKGLDHATTWTHWIAPHIHIGPINHIPVK